MSGSSSNTDDLRNWDCDLSAQDLCKSAENMLYAEDGELHEYWGTVNGNWFSGPNEYYQQIKYDGYNFLYNYLDESIFGDINDDQVVNILDVVVIVNIILSGGFNQNADINNDSYNNVLDVIQLVNIILE